MGIRVLQPGLLTTLQDLGRIGHQKSGVIVSGAMDAFSLRLANLLVGNSEHEAALEITLLGPSLEFTAECAIAITGADLSATVDNLPIEVGRVYWIPKGAQLKFGKPRFGCRAYLAAAGGWDVPKVLNSRSTYLRAGIGGHNGRALQRGDELAVKRSTSGNLSDVLLAKLSNRAKQSSDAKGCIKLHWLASSDLAASNQQEPVVRVIKGPQWDWFTGESRQMFLQKAFQLTPQSDRMGFRLKGPALQLSESRELISEGVAFGTVQVPSDGNPIVLMADRQTIGGYPKIAQVITVDLSKLAQLQPGQSLRFEEVELEEAQSLYIGREEQLRQFKLAVEMKIRGYWNGSSGSQL